MMVESKAVAVVTLLMVWQRIESSQSRRIKKSRPCTMNYIIKLTSLYFVGLFLFRGAQKGDDAFLVARLWSPVGFGSKMDVTTPTKYNDVNFIM